MWDRIDTLRVPVSVHIEAPRYYDRLLRAGLSLVVVVLPALVGCGRLAFDVVGMADEDANDGADSHADIEQPCGTAWCIESSGVPDDLSQLWGTAASNMWAVGGGGTLLHRDAAGWSVDV